MAWLHATPEKAKRSRWDQHVLSYKVEPSLPEVEYADHLIAYLLDVGPVSSDGGAIAYSEIVSWQTATGWPLTGWEASTLRELSIVYANQLSISTSKTCPAPWASAPVDRQAVAEKLSAALDRVERRRRRG